MARSHHRKKHKEHLRQFKHSHENAPAQVVKGKAVWIFAIGGAIVGLMIAYFAASSSLLWSLVGLLLGGVAGYIAGRKMDSEGNK